MASAGWCEGMLPAGHLGAGVARDCPADSVVLAGDQVARQISSREPPFLSGAGSQVFQRIVSVIDSGHDIEVSDWMVGVGRGSSEYDVERQPAACQMFVDLPVRTSEIGKESLVSNLQFFDFSKSSSEDVLAGREDFPQFSSRWEPAVWKPFADCLKGGKKGGEPGSAQQVLAEDNCRGDFYYAGLKPLPHCFLQLGDELLLGKDKVGFKSPRVIDGRPAIILDEEELFKLSMPLQLTLIGKFPAGRPKWITVKKFFGDLRLKGDFKIENLDARHIYIHFQHVEDYIRLFSKQIQYINGFLIKFIKWTLDFNVNNEPSVCPVWISLPMLSLHLYTSSMLYSIASIFGRPLCLDYATRHRVRPNTARILVELDVRIKHSNEVWIGSVQNGYFQKVCFENLPSYCLHCRKAGHCQDKCFLLYPELRKEQMAKNFNIRRHDLNNDMCKLIETENEEMTGCVGAPPLNENLLTPVGVESISNALVVSDQVGGPMVSQQSQQVDEVGKEGILRDAVSMEEGSLGLNLDISSRADFMMHSLPKGDSLDFDIAGCNTHNKASISKRFTRSSLKEIGGQQLLLQWHGTEKKMDKVFNLIDRVIDDNVRLEELKRHRENAVVLKEEEKKKREEKKFAAAARLQDKLEAKKNQGKGKGKKK